MESVVSFGGWAVRCSRKVTYRSSSTHDFGMNLQEAGEVPRVRHDGSSDPTANEDRGGEVVLEQGHSAAVVKALEASGTR